MRALQAEMDRYADTVVNAFKGDVVDRRYGALGAVAHQVGTMRMGGVVDGDLRMPGSENVYVCDLSVFPSSPAANPTLTLAALAMRLSAHLAS